MSTTPLGLVVVIEFETDVLIGAGTTIGTLMKEDGFDAVFVSTGAGLPRFPGVPGEDLIGVYSVNEFLTRVNLMRAYEAGAETPVYDLAGRPVAVVGGGNTAMDAARTALRLGGDPVTLFYRRTDDEMPARREEIEHAREEGVNFSFLVSPVGFEGEDGWLRTMQMQKMELGEPDQDGRCSPVPVEGAVEPVRADVAIIAIGNAPNPVLPEGHSRPGGHLPWHRRDRPGDRGNVDPRGVRRWRHIHGWGNRGPRHGRRASGGGRHRHLSRRHRRRAGRAELTDEQLTSLPNPRRPGRRCAGRPGVPRAKHPDPTAGTRP